MVFPTGRLVLFFVGLLLPRLALWAQPAEVYPLRSGSSTLSLNGEWKFKYQAGSDAGADEAFHDASFAAAAGWKTLAVPAHWELHGFAPPKYAKVDEGLGLYRRTFQAPKSWKGQRVFLHFDGVLYGLEAWVNGHSVGTWASSYNPVAFDVTEVLKPGAENVIAVRVSTHPKGWEFDTNDCWALSGIYRDVTLLAVPPTYFKDYTARTTLKTDGSAELAIDVAGSAAASVKGRLLAPTGKLAQEFTFPLGGEFRGSVVQTIAHPMLWTAETPNLYTLELALQVEGKTTQQISEKIGLRQITVDQGVLKLNGVAIKLHGADHHDIWPAEGRVATEELMRRDLEMMKAGNINFIRTSHYPPNPRFIELCDQLGFYVMCEVPFGFGDAHLTDPSYQDILLTRARATVTRDKNRPSVIVWSVGNENPITPIQLETGREVKRLDSTRPICYPTVGSYFARNYEKFPEFVDIYSPHYPTASTLRDFAAKLTRPVIFTEYAHQLGLASDRVQDEWQTMQTTPRFAGGAVWMFQDQGILRTSEKSAEEFGANPYVWVDAHHYYDTNQLDGMDGIVYSDRTPQIDYWQVRKVYAPVQIAERTALVHAGENAVSLHLQNRFDFRSLHGLTLQWELHRNRSTARSGKVALQAKAQESEVLSIPISIAANSAGEVWSFAVKVVDETGNSLNEQSVRLELDGAVSPITPLLGDVHASPLELNATDAETVVAHARYELHIDRATGVIVWKDRKGHVLAEGPFPHTGRRFTEAEKLRNKPADPIWAGNAIHPTGGSETKVERVGETVIVHLHAAYPRSDVPAQSIGGDETLTLYPNGSVTASYDFELSSNANGSFLEAGVGLAGPTATEFRWLGAGPYAGYPGKDALNSFGAFHLNREDLRFSGNRRETNLALLTDRSGAGFAVIASAPSDFAVESETDGVMFSQHLLLSGRGNKGSGPEVTLKASPGLHLRGEFTFFPLSGEWPASLKKWFGDAKESVEVQRPFYQSYDR